MIVNHTSFNENECWYLNSTSYSNNDDDNSDSNSSELKPMTLLHHVLTSFTTTSSSHHVINTGIAKVIVNKCSNSNGKLKQEMIRIANMLLVSNGDNSNDSNDNSTEDDDYKLRMKLMMQPNILKEIILWWYNYNNKHSDSDPIITLLAIQHQHCNNNNSNGNSTPIKKSYLLECIEYVTTKKQEQHDTFVTKVNDQVLVTMLSTLFNEDNNDRNEQQQQQIEHRAKQFRKLMISNNNTRNGESTTCLELMYKYFSKITSIVELQKQITMGGNTTTIIIDTEHVLVKLHRRPTRPSTSELLEAWKEAITKLVKMIQEHEEAKAKKKKSKPSSENTDKERDEEEERESNITIEKILVMTQFCDKLRQYEQDRLLKKFRQELPPPVVHAFLTMKRRAKEADNEAAAEEEPSWLVEHLVNNFTLDKFNMYVIRSVPMSDKWFAKLLEQYVAHVSPTSRSQSDLVTARELWKRGYNMKVLLPQSEPQTLIEPITPQLNITNTNIYNSNSLLLNYYNAQMTTSNSTKNKNLKVPNSVNHWFAKNSKRNRFEHICEYCGKAFGKLQYKLMHQRHNIVCFWSSTVVKNKTQKSKISRKAQSKQVLSKKQKI